MFGNLEVSYELDTLRLLSLGANLWNGNSKSTSERDVRMYDDAELLQYSYKTFDNGNYEFGSTGFNFDYQRSTGKKGEYFTLSYRFNQSPNDNDNISNAKDIQGTLPLNIRLNQWYDNSARTTEHSGQIDYTNPITDKHSIEAGLRYILRQNISKVNHYTLNDAGIWDPLPPSPNNDFEHISNIYAGYAGYALRLPKFGIRTGLRAEGTKQDVKFRRAENQNFDVDYYNVVPSATVSYQLKPTQQIRLGYNMRISRPSIWYLNPYVNDTDPFNISHGNPNLVPERSNSFNLNYSFFSPKYTLNVSASYSFVNNSIERYVIIKPENPEVRWHTYANIGSSQRTGLFVNAGWTPNRILRFNLNGGLNYVDMKSAQLGMSNYGLTGNTFMNAQITLPKDFRINANAMYMSGWLSLQGKQSAYYFAGLSVNKDFLEKKLTVSVSCQNPFSKYIKFTMSTHQAQIFESTYKVRMPVREARISVSYRFGTMKEAIKKVQRGITVDDVKSGGEGGGGGGVGGGMQQ